MGNEILWIEVPSRLILVLQDNKSIKRGVSELTCQKINDLLMTSLTIMWLQTSLLRVWQTNSWTFWMLTISHLFRFTPLSLTWRRQILIRFRSYWQSIHENELRLWLILKRSNAIHSLKWFITTMFLTELKEPWHIISKGGRNRSDRVWRLLMISEALLVLAPDDSLCNSSRNSVKDVLLYFTCSFT